jgi:hypothetical protein
LERWRADRPLVRAHPNEFGSTEFDHRVDADNRFSPFHHRGSVIGVVYAAADERAAASETIFHTVPAPDSEAGEVRPRRVLLDRYRSWEWSTIAPRRDLDLISLRGAGLDALHTSRKALILSDRRAYPTTRAWAAALYQAAEAADGLWWSSRQSPPSGAVMLFDRRARRSGGVARSDLEAAGPSEPFLSDAGLNRLLDIALDLDITLVT